MENQYQRNNYIFWNEEWNLKEKEDDSTNDDRRA